MVLLKCILNTERPRSLRAALIRGIQPTAVVHIGGPAT